MPRVRRSRVFKLIGKDLRCSGIPLFRLLPALQLRDHPWRHPLDNLHPDGAFPSAPAHRHFPLQQKAASHRLHAPVLSDELFSDISSENRSSHPCFAMTRSISRSSIALSSVADSLPSARCASVSFQPGGTQQASDMIGTERRLGTPLPTRRRRALRPARPRGRSRIPPRRNPCRPRRHSALAGRPFHELDDQRRLHAIDHVVVDELVTLLEQMRHHAMITGRGNRKRMCAGRMWLMLVRPKNEPIGPSIGIA